jgi:oligo-alginate lyase
MSTVAPSPLETCVRALGPAPRLFASAADWLNLRMRIQSDPTSATIHRATRARADALLTGPLLVHTKAGNRRLTSARLFQSRIIDLATVARLGDDPRYAARAREELLAVAAMPDWGQTHYLDVAEYALGVAIGLDWLHDSLSAAERDTLAQALIERALRPTFDGTSPSLAWLGGKSNWTQVCHAGLAAAALAIADREPALAVRTLERAIAEQAGPNAAYAPDGVYPEGPMYWAYGTTFEVILISLLEHSLGTDHGLSAAPGFLASADYLTQVTAPSGRYFNYADAREFVPPRPVLHWFAQKRAQPIEGELQAIYERHDALALWWRVGGTTSVSSGSKYPNRPHGGGPSQGLPLAWLGHGENPVAVFRSAWDNPHASCLAIKGGSASTSHAHMDAGGFIFEARGVRWAVDTGMQDYESLESAGIQIWDGRQDGARWGVFRLGPESHNILRFDSARPRIDGSARFTAFDPAASAPSATLDLTPLHVPAARSVTRHARLLPGGSVVLEDRWTAGAQPVAVAFQWLTFADVEPTPGGALLRQHGETLRLLIESPARWTLAVEDATGLLAPADEPNPGLRRIVIHLATPANQPGTLRVSALPDAASTVDVS